ncbi:MAG: hypothetical protein ACTHM6_02695 [Tepidisphaeraceae bacterium]
MTLPREQRHHYQHAVLAMFAALLCPTLGLADPAAPGATCAMTTVDSVEVQQPTSLVPLGLGQTLIAQRGRLEVIGGAGTAQDFELSIGQFARALNVPDSAVSIAAAVGISAGDLLFYTTGTSADRSATGLWLYDRRTRALSVIADAQTLGRESGMGNAIDLGRGQLAVVGNDVWLMVRNVDATVFFRLDRRQLADSGTARLSRPFKALMTPDHLPFRVQPEDRVYGVASADGAVLELLRTTSGESWRIAADGTARFDEESTSHPPTALPALALPPERFGGRNLMLRFFPEAITPTGGLPPLPDPDAGAGPRYPTLVVNDGSRATVIDRDAIRMRAGFPVHALRLTAWCVDPASGDVIAYDAMSGEVLRLHLSGI